MLATQSDKTTPLVAEVEGSIINAVLGTQVFVLMPIKHIVRTPRLRSRMPRSVPGKQSGRLLLSMM
jgi:hypothetical protein